MPCYKSIDIAYCAMFSVSKRIVIKCPGGEPLMIPSYTKVMKRHLPLYIALCPLNIVVKPNGGSTPQVDH